MVETRPGYTPVIIDAQARLKTFAWIARHADDWFTTPQDTDLFDRITHLKAAWSDAGIEGLGMAGRR